MPVKKLHIISHTHWDREWYLTFQRFRLKLVDLIDKLLDILQNDPDYKYFHLDGQTVVLEDYFEMRPENRDRLKKLVEEGRILIGPWYVLCDEFMVSGESIIRNLLLGHQIAQEYGAVMKVGYVIDAFGHISQMPQILQAFGIDNAILWRGIGGPNFRSEFYWRSPDGSQVLTYKVPDAGGYCYGVNLPTDQESLLKLLQEIIHERSQHTPLNHLLLMNGCDHIEPQAELSSIIQKANKILEGTTVIHNTLPQFFQLLKENVSKLSTIMGELRDNQYVNLLCGTISTRMYLKQQNNRSQILLEKFAEPLAAICWTLAGRYPKAQIWQAWKYLLKNQPHDSICGCSVDEVHEQMMTQYAWSQEIASEIIDQSIHTIFDDIDLNDLSANEATVFVFNPLSWKRTDVATVRVDFHPESDIFYVSVFDDQGQEIPCQLEKIETVEKLSIDPIAGPKSFMVKQITVQFLAENIQSCGYRCYRIKPVNDIPEVATDLLIGPDFMENQFLAVKINRDGTFNLHHKKSGQIFNYCNLFEDSGDAGDEYTFSYPLKDAIITGFSEQPKITLIEKGPVRATFRVEGTMHIPISLNSNYQARSTQFVANPIVADISLSALSERVEITTEIENRARDHRLRVLFPYNIKAVTSYAGGSFDVVERRVELPSKKGWLEDPPATHPFQIFVDVSDHQNGLTLASADLTEYEVKNNTCGTIALTLLRCVGWLARFDLLTRKGRDGWRFETPGGQCPGKYRFQYAVIPHSNSYEASKSYRIAFQEATPLLSKQIHNQVKQLPLNGGFLTVSPSELVVSAIKKSEKNNSLIIRLYNISKKPCIGKIQFYQEIERAQLVDLAENPITNLELPVEGGHSISLNIGEAKIMTLELFLKKENGELKFNPPTYKIVDMKNNLT